MKVTLDIPETLLRGALEREGTPDVPRAVLEAVAVEAYREGRVTLGEMAMSLGMGSIEALDWLGRRGVPLNYTLEDLEEDRKTLDRLLGPVRAARKGPIHP